MKLISCNSNRPLAIEIAHHLKTPLAEATIRQFADNEIFVEIFIIKLVLFKVKTTNLSKRCISKILTTKKVATFNVPPFFFSNVIVK